MNEYGWMLLFCKMCQGTLEQPLMDTYGTFEDGPHESVHGYLHYGIQVGCFLLVF